MHPLLQFKPAPIIEYTDTNYTSTSSLLQEVLDDLGFHVVAGLIRHQGAKLPELSQETVLVLGVTSLSRQAGSLRSAGGTFLRAAWLSCTKKDTEHW